ncbi:MAG: DUF2652 domain-containing protein [Acidimicrobiia bacterium]
MENRGFVLIADITGYTVYLRESELEHAQGTLTQLLELLIEHTRPPLVISTLEGDAVFSYALDKGFVSGQTFLEGIETTYVAFRRAIELMVLNNSCQCNACANVSALDLKFFVHHGSFAIQQVGGGAQLMGNEIILIHRLLKNSVTATTGIRAYLLCTDAAVGALGIEAAQEMVRHHETVTDLGEVDVWIKDMHPVYESRRDDDQVTYEGREVLSTVAAEIPMSRELVWDYLNQTEYRNLLIGSDSFEVRDRKDGKVGSGSTYICYHGKMIVPQEVIEWRPFERVLVQQRLPFKGRQTYVLVDFRLTPTDTGTRLTETAARLTGPIVKRALARMFIRSHRRRSQRDLDNFADQIQGDLALHDAPRPSALSADDIATQALASLEVEG